MNLQIEFYEKPNVPLRMLITYQTPNFFRFCKCNKFMSKYYKNYDSGNFVGTACHPQLKSDEIYLCGYSVDSKERPSFVDTSNYGEYTIQSIKDILLDWAKNCSDIKNPVDKKLDDYVKEHFFNSPEFHKERKQLIDSGYTLSETFTC